MWKRDLVRGIGPRLIPNRDFCPGQFPAASHLPVLLNAHSRLFDRWMDSLRRHRFAAQDNFFVIIEEMPKGNYLGEFELLVMLTVIRLGEGAYGVPISREIEQQTGRDVAFGTVYATLERLQGKGLVSSDLGDATPERGGRAKRYFRVTATGLRRVRETKQSLIRLWRGLRELEGGVA